jgi:hypothetical protein
MLKMFSNQKEDKMKQKIKKDNHGRTTYYYEPYKNNTGRFGFINKQPAKEDFWETKIDEVKECSKAPSNVSINMNQLAVQKIKLLNEKFKNIEWLAYLVGKENEIEDIYIPFQEVSSVTVDNIKSPEYNTLNIIGVIHSHHNMGNSFSNTDDEYINQNHDISICVTSDMKMNAQVRWKTPCGASKLINGIVNTYYIKDNSWVDGFLKNIDERITVKNFHLPEIYNGWEEYKKKGNFVVKNGNLVDDDDNDWYFDKNDDLSDDDDILGYEEDEIKGVDEMMNNMTIEEEMDLYNQMVDEEIERSKNTL